MRKSANDEAAVRGVLEGAANGNAIVRVKRRGMPPWPRDCFVVGVSPHLTLLQPVADRLDLDGYAVVRTPDVSEATPSPKAKLLDAAFRLKGVRYEPADHIDLSSMRAAIGTIANSYGVLVVRRERTSRAECEVGQVAELRAQTYRLRWLTPMAEVEEDERWFRFADVTMLQFDGEYEKTLAALAGLKPAVRRRPRGSAVRARK